MSDRDCPAQTSPWQVTPNAGWQRRVDWGSGAFEAARRERTAHVEGTIRSDRHLIMVTLAGGAREHAFTTADGFRHRGADRPGSVSFLPAGCQRRLELRDVAWEWAAIALPKEAEVAIDIAPFACERDEFLGGLLGQFRTLEETDDGLDPLYCETMALAARHYLARRSAKGAAAPKSGGLTPVQLRRVQDYVAASLAEEIRIARLAEIANLSEGYFHRAFRQTTARSPLRYVNEQRVARSADLLAQTDASVLAIAMDVGFLSASHFARIFRTIKGVSPDTYRRAL